MIITIDGMTCSGKTTFGRRLKEDLGIRTDMTHPNGIVTELKEILEVYEGDIGIDMDNRDGVACVLTLFASYAEILRRADDRDVLIGEFYWRVAWYCINNSVSIQHISNLICHISHTGNLELPTHSFFLNVKPELLLERRRDRNKAHDQSVDENQAMSDTVKLNQFFSDFLTTNPNLHIIDNNKAEDEAYEEIFRICSGMR